MVSTRLKAQYHDLEEIKKVMHEQERAWNKGDIHTFMQSYWKSDSFRSGAQRSQTACQRMSQTDTDCACTVSRVGITLICRCSADR